MKPYKISPIALFLIMATVISCKNENIIPSKGSLKFSWSSSKRDHIGSRVNNSLSPSAVLIEVRDINRHNVEQNKKLTLYKFGNSFISESLALPKGSYVLIQFAVLDSANNALYATPLEGTDLAQYVSDPLPIEFSITENGNTLVTPQVIPVSDNDSPEIFGFVSFGFNIVSDSISHKIKNRLRYTYQVDCACFIPSSLTEFSYSNYQLANIDEYAYDVGVGFRRNNHYEIEYHPDSSFYQVNIWLVYDDVPYKKLWFYQYFLNGQNQVKRIIYNSLQEGESGILFTDEYVYSPSGYTTQRTIYPPSNSNPIIKSEYLTSAGNLQTVKYFGGMGNLLEEVRYTYNSTLNPLHDISLFLGEEYKSKNNILEKVTSPTLKEDFIYNYDSHGQVVEVIATSSDGTKSRTVYQYY